MKLTSKAVAALTLPPGVSDRTFFDDDIGGFGVRLRQGGAARYVIQYDVGGKTKRVTLGTITLLDASTARAKAKDLLASVRLGGDPASEKRAARVQAAETFGAILPRYLTKMRDECRPRSFKEIESRLCRLARPLHSRPIASIDRRAISHLISQLAERNGPSAAINVHGTMSGYFAWLMREGLIEQNPMIGSNRPAKRPARDRLPSQDEVRTLWTALPDDDYGDIVRLLHYTLARRGEIGGLRWDEIDLDRGVIELPGTRMKNHKPHVIPLSDPALAILRRRERNGREHVFGRGTSGYQGWSRRRKDLDDGIAGKRPTWTLHDIRRFGSTVMHEKLGIQPHIVEAVLAHVGHQSGVAGVYNKASYLVEKRSALKAWADWLDSVVSGKQPTASKVVKLRG
jgi:integrase